MLTGAINWLMERSGLIFAMSVSFSICFAGQSSSHKLACRLRNMSLLKWRGNYKNSEELHNLFLLERLYWKCVDDKKFWPLYDIICMIFGVGKHKRD